MTWEALDKASYYQLGNLTASSTSTGWAGAAPPNCNLLGAIGDSEPLGRAFE